MNTSANLKVLFLNLSFIFINCHVLRSIGHISTISKIMDLHDLILELGELALSCNPSYTWEAKTVGRLEAERSLLSTPRLSKFCGRNTTTLHDEGQPRGQQAPVTRGGQ